MASVYHMTKPYPEIKTSGCHLFHALIFRLKEIKYPYKYLFVNKNFTSF